jgi:putative ubiquitin-RnfH superfamily antitoxin RatB of RatAB toxin-antitoxin module
MSLNLLRITVVYSSEPREVSEHRLELSPLSTVKDALVACQAFENFPRNVLTDDGKWAIGVWGRPVTDDYVLRDEERLEIYRPLKVDPKVARRERFQKQGSRAAGLFATRRKGAKPGY